MCKEVLINNKNISNYIESLLYEINIRKDLIGFLNSSGKSMNDFINKYTIELEEFKFMYDESLNVLIDLYVNNNLTKALGSIVCKCFDIKQGILKLKGSNTSSE